MNRDVMIAKDLKNGSLMCTVCSTQVKAKVWTAHVNGRTHVENVKRLKQATSSTQSAQSGTKRKQGDEEKLAGHIHKRLRVEESREAQSTTNSSTPWRAEAQRQTASENEGKFKNVKIIEGLPAGFFDDNRMNSRVKDTLEKEIVLDTEVERFFKEVSEVDNKMEDADEKAAEVISIQRDLDLIDDQMARWKSINELEIKKESLVKSVQRGSASTAGAQNHNIRDCRSGPTGMESPTTIAVDDSTDDDELEVDWRTKTL